MALNNKCANCGYNFKPEDGNICPSCLAARQEESSASTASAYTTNTANQNYRANNQPAYQGNYYSPKKNNANAVIIVIVSVTIIAVFLMSVLSSLSNRHTEDNEASVSSEESSSDDADNYYDAGQNMPLDEYYPLCVSDFGESAVSFDEQYITRFGLKYTYSRPYDLDINKYNGYKTKEGNKIVCVSLRIQNDMNHSQLFYQNLMVEGNDDDEREFFQINGFFEDATSETIDVPQKTTISKTVYFEVPEKLEGLSFVSYEEEYSLDGELVGVDKYYFS